MAERRLTRSDGPPPPRVAGEDRRRTGSPAAPRGAGRADLVAGALTGVWLLGIAALSLLLPGDDGIIQGAAMLVAILLPVALIWAAVGAARVARARRSETAALRGAVDALRRDVAALSSGGSLPAPGDRPASDVADRLDRIAAAQDRLHDLVASLSLAERAPSSAPPPASPDRAGHGSDRPNDTTPSLAAQGDLPLVTTGDEDAPPPGMDDMIRALQFPVDADDRAGFAAMRRVLRDRRAGQIVTAAQDVLTLLSRDGIYTDDLAPHPADPAVWRAFARGERGGAVTAMAGVHDDAAHETAAARMRGDAIFRDTVHHFLRLFDRTLAGLEPDASDGDMIAIADTRTARAFVLLGRITGMFD